LGMWDITRGCFLAMACWDTEDSVMARAMVVMARAMVVMARAMADTARAMEELAMVKVMVTVATRGQQTLIHLFLTMKLSTTLLLW